MFINLREREKERERERERERISIGYHPEAPQPRIKPATFWCMV